MEDEPTISMKNMNGLDKLPGGPASLFELETTRLRPRRVAPLRLL
jgi:hypothetical protein